MISNELLKKKILDKAIHGRLVENDSSLKPIDVQQVYDDIPFEVPNNWKWAKLSDVSEFNVGKTPPTKNSIYWGDEIDWVSIADMNHRKLVQSTHRKLSNRALNSIFNNKLVPAGTLLMSFKLTIGRLAITSKECVHNEAIISIYPKQYLLRDYLMNALDALDLEKNVKSAIKGKTLNSKSLANIFIPIPPLEEQKKIVKRIEELFELIDKKEKNDKEKEKLKEVLKSKVLEEKLLIGDIAIHKLSDFLEKTHNVNWKDTTKEFCYIDLSSVDRQKHIIEKTSIIDYNNAPSRAKQIVKKNDVLFGTTRPLLGRVCIVDEKYDNQICSTGFCVMRPKKDLLNSKFLEFIIRSSEFIKYIEPLQRGVSYPAVSDKDVYNYEIPIPPLEQQKKIVEKIEECFKLIEQL